MWGLENALKLILDVLYTLFLSAVIAGLRIN